MHLQGLPRQLLARDMQSFTGHRPSYSCAMPGSYRGQATGEQTLMRIDRRKALAMFGLGAAGPAAAQLPKPLSVTFQHGVASGDPKQDRVVLWTRITPESPHKQIAYTWKLNPLDRRAGGAKSGSGVTGPERDYTVKVDVGGL